MDGTGRRGPGEREAARRAGARKAQGRRGRGRAQYGYRVFRGIAAAVSAREVVARIDDILVGAIDLAKRLAEGTAPKGLGIPVAAIGTFPKTKVRDGPAGTCPNDRELTIGVENAAATAADTRPARLNVDTDALLGAVIAAVGRDRSGAVLEPVVIVATGRPGKGARGKVGGLENGRSGPVVALLLQDVVVL